MINGYISTSFLCKNDSEIIIKRSNGTFTKGNIKINKLFTDFENVWVIVTWFDETENYQLEKGVTIQNMVRYNPTFDIRLFELNFKDSIFVPDVILKLYDIQSRFKYDENHMSEFISRIFCGIQSRKELGSADAYFDIPVTLQSRDCIGMLYEKNS